jgi:hypothetical protein
MRNDGLVETSTSSVDIVIPSELHERLLHVRQGRFYGTVGQEGPRALLSNSRSQARHVRCQQWQSTLVSLLLRGRI